MLPQIVPQMLVQLLLIIGFVNAKPQYCTPSNTECWPTANEITTFSSKLDGQLLTPNDTNNTEYLVYVNMTENLLHRNQYPSFIIVINSVSDIQESIKFASSHNIQISIMSTGHSWSGRSTTNSLQINLSQMRSYSVNNTNPNSTTITVETGVRWGEISKLQFLWT